MEISPAEAAVHALSNAVDDLYEAFADGPEALRQPIEFNQIVEAHRRLTDILLYLRPEVR